MIGHKSYLILIANRNLSFTLCKKKSVKICACYFISLPLYLIISSLLQQTKREQINQNLSSFSFVIYLIAVEYADISAKSYFSSRYLLNQTKEANQSLSLSDCLEFLLYAGEHLSLLFLLA